MDGLAVVAGVVRLASGVSFLVAPSAANRLWGGDPSDESATASLLLRSMGYRDALIGGGLLRAGLRGSPSSVSGWFLASAGADAADLWGGLANHSRLPARSRAIGLGGALAGACIGLGGALRTGLDRVDVTSVTSNVRSMKRRRRSASCSCSSRRCAPRSSA